MNLMNLIASAKSNPKKLKFDGNESKAIVNEKHYIVGMIIVQYDLIKTDSAKYLTNADYDLILKVVGNPEYEYYEEKIIYIIEQVELYKKTL